MNFPRTALILLSMPFAGCMTPGETDPVDGTTGTTSEEVGLTPGAFTNLHVVDGTSCKPLEVMIGIHVNDKKAICAELNYDYRIDDRYVDGWPSTPVSFSPAMHGCAPNYFIQGIILRNHDELLTCVSLETANGVALRYSGTLHDGRGSTVIASVTTYGLSPNMHVCPSSFAMVGFHKAQNDLYCAD